MKLLHLIKKTDVLGLFAQQLGLKDVKMIVKELEDFTQSFFCGAAATSVGKAAMDIVPQNTTCMNMVLGLSDLMAGGFLGKTRRVVLDIVDPFFGFSRGAVCVLGLTVRLSVCLVSFRSFFLNFCTFVSREEQLRAP